MRREVVVLVISRVRFARKCIILIHVFRARLLKINAIREGNRKKFSMLYLKVLKHNEIQERREWK